MYSELGLVSKEVIKENYKIIRLCTQKKTNEAEVGRMPILECLELRKDKEAEKMGIIKWEEYMSAHCLDCYDGENEELKVINYFKHIKQNHSKHPDPNRRLNITPNCVLAKFTVFDLKDLFDLTSIYDPRGNYPTYVGLYPKDDEHRNNFNKDTADALLNYVYQNNSYIYINDLKLKYPEEFT